LRPQRTGITVEEGKRFGLLLTSRVNRLPPIRPWSNDIPTGVDPSSRTGRVDSQSLPHDLEHRDLRRRPTGWHDHVFVAMFFRPGNAHEDVSMPPQNAFNEVE
jgi:hypothetical protein